MGIFAPVLTVGTQASPLPQEFTKSAGAARDSQVGSPLSDPIRCTLDAISCTFALSWIGVHHGKHTLQAI